MIQKLALHMRRLPGDPTLLSGCTPKSQLIWSDFLAAIDPSDMIAHSYQVVLLLHWHCVVPSKISSYSVSLPWPINSYWLICYCS